MTAAIPPQAQRRRALRRMGQLVLSLAAPQVVGATGSPTILAVRVWPASDYTRVTIESDQALDASHHLTPDANESQQGFLLNHLISEELPTQHGAGRVSNSDPITGQAAWYDVRVRVVKAAHGEAAHTEPQFAPLHRYPGMAQRPEVLATPPDTPTRSRPR